MVKRICTIAFTWIGILTLAMFTYTTMIRTLRKPVWHLQRHHNNHRMIRPAELDRVRYYL